MSTYKIEIFTKSERERLSLYLHWYTKKSVKNSDTFNLFGHICIFHSQPCKDL